MKRLFLKAKLLLAIFIFISISNLSIGQESLTLWLRPQQLDSLVQSKARADLRLVDLSGYLSGEKIVYVAIWNKSANADMQVRFEMKEKDFKKTVNEMKGRGYRPGRISSIDVNGSAEFTVIFHKATKDWTIEYQTSEKKFDNLASGNAERGYGMVDACIYKLKNEATFITVWEKGARSYHYDGALTEDKYARRDGSQQDEGFSAARLTGYAGDFIKYYSAIWIPTGKQHYTLFGINENMLKAEVGHAKSDGREIKAINVISKNSKPAYDVIFEGEKSNSISEILRTIKSKAWTGSLKLISSDDASELESAKSGVDALDREKSSNWLPEFWWCKWDVYSSIAGSEKLTTKYPDASSEAVYALMNYKLIKSDPTELKESGGYSFAKVYNALSAYAYGFYKNKDYKKAFNEYKRLVELSDIMVENNWLGRKFDTAAYYLAGITGEYAKDIDCIDYYSRIADKQIALDKYYHVYALLIHYYHLEQNLEKSKNYMAFARKSFPARIKELDELETQMQNEKVDP
jgi:hypothetical protein